MTNRDHDRDTEWMRRALELAEGSRGLASPNPHVGCVLVRGGRIVGRGAHFYDRKDHAEAVALREAGAASHGATAYVTLEPCAHTGRTGPCADALIAAGVARVVIATGDPNPLVNGEGAARLRDHGIAITFGVLIEEARALNDGFARWVRSGTPFVLLKAALSLDGRIAPSHTIKPPGSVAYLTGARALLAVQTLRHSVDALLTGIGTVLEDNPLITDRSGRPRRRRLLRVVLDSQLRLPLESRLVQSTQQDVLLLTGESADPTHQRRRAALEAAGVAVQCTPTQPDGRLDLRAALRALARERGILSVMAEGGSRLNRTLLESDEGHSPIADRLCLFYAPTFLGEEGVPLLAGAVPPGVEIQGVRATEVGSDVCIEASLRDAWREAAVVPAAEPIPAPVA